MGYACFLRPMTFRLGIKKVRKTLPRASSPYKSLISGEQMVKQLRMSYAISRKSGQRRLLSICPRKRLNSLKTHHKRRFLDSAAFDNWR